MPQCNKVQPVCLHCKWDRVPCHDVQLHQALHQPLVSLAASYNEPIILCPSLPHIQHAGDQPLIYGAWLLMKGQSAALCQAGIA